MEISEPGAPVASLLDYDRAGLRGLFQGWGLPAFRGDQVFRWIHQRAEFDVARWSDIAKPLRQRIAAECALSRMEPAQVHVSADGTVKFRFDVPDGSIEAVLIPGDPEAARDEEGDREGTGESKPLAEPFSSLGADAALPATTAATRLHEGPERQRAYGAHEQGARAAGARLAPVYGRRMPDAMGRVAVPPSLDDRDRNTVRDPELRQRVFGTPPAPIVHSRMRNTLCISSQVGCAMGCAFCYTATLGLRRHLTVSEILGQFHAVNAWLRDRREAGLTPAGYPTTAEDATPRVTNIVFMGMGEPLHNYERVRTACRVLLDEMGPGLSARRVTISTSGLVAKMRLVAEELPVMLALSLNATDDATRSRIMPVNKAHPIEELLAAVREFPAARRKRVFLEYVLIDGVNDTLEDARRLARMSLSTEARVNLIPFNPHPGSPFRSPPPERVLEFQKTLLNHRVRAFLRLPRGRDVYAACGMLANHGVEGVARRGASARKLPPSNPLNGAG